MTEKTIYTVIINKTEEVTNWTERSYREISTDDEGKAEYGYPEQVPQRSIKTVKVFELSTEKPEVTDAVAKAVLETL